MTIPKKYEIINGSEPADLRSHLTGALENNDLVISWGTNSIYGNSSLLTKEVNGQPLILGKHTIVLINYNPDTDQITFMDPYTGEIYLTDPGKMPIQNMELFDQLVLHPPLDSQ